VDSLWVNGENAISYYYISPIISIALPSYLQDNDTVDIRVWYSGGQVIELYGWGGIHYHSNDLIYTLNVALMEDKHSFARSWFPCKDYYADKATYNLNITAQNDRKVVCGGILDSVNAITDSSNTFFWHIPQQIPPYLVSLTIGNYILIEDTIKALEREIPLNIYCFQQDSLALKGKIPLIKDAFHTLEDCFGAFKFNRVGYSVTPLGSMEHVDNIALAQSAAINQGDENNSNIIHELGHSWFGNYFGGYDQRDMWIKEGWTSYTEKISFEGHYGKEYSKDYFRNRMEYVLNKMPKEEGYMALYGVEGKDVYSNTIYRKGAMVVSSLRGYLGDSLFFPSVKTMLENYPFYAVNTFQLRDILSDITSIDLNPFFDFYVLDSGYNHYSITSKTFGLNSCTIKIEQRTIKNENNSLAFSRVPVTFVDENWNKEKRIISFQGEETQQTISLNYTPINCFLDLEEEFSDARMDNYKIIKGNSQKEDFKNTYFFAKIVNNPDSIFLRTTLSFIGEKEDKALPYGIERISRKHYWTIEGMNLENKQVEGNFYYTTLMGNNNFDNELIDQYTSLDSLILLYRPNASAEWIPIMTTNSGAMQGYLTLTSLWQGDYIMAIGDKSVVELKDINLSNTANINVVPNPAKNGKINVVLQNIDKNYVLNLMTISGNIVYNTIVKKGDCSITINKNLPKGIYILSLISRDGENALRKKVIVM
jgi:hypothetical protein